MLCDADDTNIEDFLNLGKKHEAKIFIIHKGVFKSQEILDELGIDETESSVKVKNQIKNLKKYESRIEFLSLSWISESIIFEYASISDWVDEIDVIKNKIIDANSDEDIGYSRLKEKSLPQAKVKEIGKLVAKHPDFFTNQYNQERLGTILSEVLEQKEIKENTLGYFDRSVIQSEARAYFDKYLIKEKEKEMIEKIAELKSEGLPKVAIRSKLGITEGMLNKYYY